MTSRMVGSVLTFVILLLSVAGGAAQTYTQMQWGMNKGVTPYAFGANINGTWRDLGTVSSGGIWSIPSSNLSFTQTGTGANAYTVAGKLQNTINLQDFCSSSTLNTVAGDVTSCLQNAINQAAETGACLIIPATPVSTVYWTITSTINIGNGSPGVSSTKNNICMQGAGSSSIYGVYGSYFVWAGAPNGTMFKVNGPIRNLYMERMNLAGFNIAGTIIDAAAPQFSSFNNLNITSFRNYGIKVYANSAPGEAAFMNEFAFDFITSDYAGATGMFFSGPTITPAGPNYGSDSLLSTIRNTRIVLTGANNTGLYLGYADNMIFEEFHTDTTFASGSCGVTFDAAPGGYGGNNFPKNHLFIKTAISNTCVLNESATNKIGINTFVDFGVEDLEIIPTHPKLRGVTEYGETFNGWGYPKALTISALPACDAASLGQSALVSNGTDYATGTYGSAVLATGIVTRSILCTNTAGATTYAWAYN